MSAQTVQSLARLLLYLPAILCHITRVIQVIDNGVPMFETIDKGFPMLMGIMIVRSI